MNQCRRLGLSLLALASLLAAPAAHADWPQYRHNPGRTGYTEAALPAGLSLRWTHQAANAPQPAWPRSDRMPFDRAAQPVVADGRLFYGDSVDGIVRARDLASGPRTRLCSRRSPETPAARISMRATTPRLTPASMRSEPRWRRQTAGSA